MSLGKDEPEPEVTVIPDVYLDPKELRWKRIAQWTILVCLLLTVAGCVGMFVWQLQARMADCDAAIAALKSGPQPNPQFDIQQAETQQKIAAAHSAGSAFIGALVLTLLWCIVLLCLYAHRQDEAVWRNVLSATVLAPLMPISVLLCICFA